MPDDYFSQFPDDDDGFEDIEQRTLVSETLRHFRGFPKVLFAQRKIYQQGAMMLLYGFAVGIIACELGVIEPDLIAAGLTAVFRDIGILCTTGTVTVLGTSFISGIISEFGVWHAFCLAAALLTVLAMLPGLRFPAFHHILHGSIIGALLMWYLDHGMGVSGFQRDVMLFELGMLPCLLLTYAFWKSMYEAFRGFVHDESERGQPFRQICSIWLAYLLTIWAIMFVLVFVAGSMEPAFILTYL